MNALLFVFTFAYLTLAALGQRISIGAPAEWTTVKPGSNITVEVDRPMTLTGSQEVSIAIGLWPCAGYGDAANRTCADVDVTQVLGNVVYAGPYNPQLVQGQEAWKPPYQNFTVTVPSTFEDGQVSLGVAHFSLIGAGAMPFMEVLNITLIVKS
ncbi:hypothetical protein GY45DRAFT_54352 [Cubamyces sp. BRFM 1775]|nr:hypothetical protein GY45DRAFT_54352 [Cubamyces sp. BRFM 1775]